MLINKCEEQVALLKKHVKGMIKNLNTVTALGVLVIRYRLGLVKPVS